MILFTLCVCVGHLIIYPTHRCIYYWPSPSSSYSSSSNLGRISRKSTGDLFHSTKNIFLFFFFDREWWGIHAARKSKRGRVYYFRIYRNEEREANFIYFLVVVVVAKTTKTETSASAARVIGVARRGAATETIYRFDFIMTSGRNKTRKIEMEKSGEREKKTTRFNGTRNLSLFFHGYCSASLRLVDYPLV